MNSGAHLALVHHPTLDRTGKIVTTAITSLDMHDLARLARTYGLGGVFVQTDQAAQVRLAGRLLGHWLEGWGANYNPNRKEALSIVSLVASIEESVARIEQKCGCRPLVAATSAKFDGPPRLSYAQARERLSGGATPSLVLFGTGWGLANEVLSMCDFVIEPIGSPSGYNHLSVRSAASITVDRLFGN